MNDISAKEFGRLQAEVEELRRVTDRQTVLIEQIGAQLVEVKETLSEAKGGWRMLMLVGGAGAAAGAVLTKALYIFMQAPK